MAATLTPPRPLSTKIRPTPKMLASRRRQVEAIHPHARTFEVTTCLPVLRHHDVRADQVAQTLTLVTPNHDDPDTWQLYVGSEPIARSNWTIDDARERLSFRQGSGGDLTAGQLHLTHDMTAGYGALQVATSSFTVEINVKPVTYDMKVASGAAWAAGTSSAIQLKWDTTDARWTSAAWTDSAMTLTYGIVKSGSIAGQHVYFLSLEFTDEATGETWKPPFDTYEAHMTQAQVLSFTLNEGFTPQPDPSNPFEHFVSKRFPYRVEVSLDAFATNFEGAMLTGENDLAGTVYGLQGAYDAQAIAGTYALETCDAASHVGVHDGRLVVNGSTIDTSEGRGNRVHWVGLPATAQEATGLPESGHLEFSPDGSAIVGGSTDASGERIRPDEALLARSLTLPAPATANDNLPSDLNFLDLLAMDQFQKDENGGLYDAVQAESMQDFYQIVQYYMPEDQRREFINPAPTIDLNPTIKGIAGLPGSDGTPAATFYDSLSTSYLCATLSRWSGQDGSELINGNRAGKSLRSATKTSSVFNTQAPLLYANRWVLRFTETQKFLDDQKINAAAWAPYVQTDAASWKSELLANVVGTSEQIADLTKMVDDISAKGQNGQYWAYVVFRYVVQAPFLNLLQSLTFSGTGPGDGSDFTQRVQRISAVLNVLDPSGFFNEQFMHTVQLFQISNVLPQLFDYTGNFADYSYAVNAIYKEFVAKNIDSPDPGLKAAAEAMQQVIAQGKVDDLLQAFQQAAIALKGLYSWGRLMTTFESKVAKVFGSLPKIAIYGVALAAVGFLIMGFVSGQIKWSQLDTLQKVKIIGSGVAVVGSLVLAIVRRGLASGAIFDVANQSQFRLWFIGPDALTAAQQRVSKRLAKALNAADAEGNMEAAADAEIAEMTDAVAAEVPEGATNSFWFGRNLDEFLATRVGTFLAIIGLVMSAIALAHAQAPLEIASDILFVIASSLEVLAAAGGWIIGGTALAETAFGALAVTSIIPIVNVVVAVLVVIGIVLMMIFLGKKPESPVEKFAKSDEVANAGFYSPFGSNIDDLAVYPTGTGPQVSGVSLLLDGATSQAITLSSTSATVGAMDHTAATTFYLTVDGKGQCRFVAPLVDSQGRPSARLLTMDPSGNVTAQAPFSDPAKLDQQLFIADMLGAATKDGDHIASAPFAFQGVAAAKASLATSYLGISGTSLVGVSDKVTWVASMQTAAPAGLAIEPLQLFSYDHDRVQLPTLAMPGSAPRTWSIDPALPSWMTLDAKTGRIAQASGVDPQVMAATDYTLSVSNGVGTASATFTLSVQQG